VGKKKGKGLQGLRELENNICLIKNGVSKITRWGKKKEDKFFSAGHSTSSQKNIPCQEKKTGQQGGGGGREARALNMQFALPYQVRQPGGGCAVPKPSD